MSERLSLLEKKIAELYLAKNPNREEWSDWLWTNHVLVVADFAEELAERYGANAEYARASALLHDIADTITTRFDESHEAKSLEIGRKLLTESSYSPEEISLIIDDAVKFHSCHGTNSPKSLEGKILAAADSCGHLRTDFYIFAAWFFGKNRTLEELKEWALKKIDRDLYAKVFFDDLREELRPDYDRIKELFSR